MATKTGTRSESTATQAEIKACLVPVKPEDTVRVLGLRDCKMAAATLADAFAADSYAKYFCDLDDASTSPEQTWRLHVDIMTYMTRAHCLIGVVAAIGAHFDGVMLCLPPGKELGGWWTILRSGFWRLAYQLSAEGKRRYLGEAIPALQETKASVLGHRLKEAYCITFLGTKPDARGRGLATKLLSYVLQQADAENRPVYLESSPPENNAFYARHGFEFKREIVLKRGQAPIRLSVMVRDPRPVRNIGSPVAIGNLDSA